MSLNETLSANMKSVPGCKFAGYVDLDQGLILGFSPAQIDPPDMPENLAATMTAYFQTPAATDLGAQLSKAVKSDPALGDYFQELVIGDENSIYLCLRLPKQQTHAVCYRCSDNGDPNAALAAARKTLEAYEGLL